MYLLFMAIRPETLPTDAAALTEMVLALDAENEKLRVLMRTLNDMIFGKRSERLACDRRRAARAGAGRSRDRCHAASACERRYACDQAAREPTEEGEAQHRRTAQALAALRTGDRA